MLVLFPMTSASCDVKQKYFETFSKAQKNKVQKPNSESKSENQDSETNSQS
ncbi:hypothetical protein HYD46_02055 [Mycoplasmopsis bovis]|nr:hypothetical protein [Mycoplasmopsis bovis]QQH78220.1 hypothetical protein HYD46_02055 [Mycoplasmopsis bovis]